MYKKIKSRYDKGYIRIDQLKRYVELGIITQEQYETICGKEYLKGDENADTEDFDSELELDDFNDEH